MFISSLLAADSIVTDAQITSKKRLLELVAAKAAEELELPQATIFNQLIERERLGSTGLGQGFAVPHARLDSLQHTHACFYRLDDGVNYDAIDRQPVDLIFVLFIPEASTDEHLQILATLAKIFSQTEICDAIRRSSDRHEILSVIQKAETRLEQGSAGQA
jgi:PTS system nitrogen regulatory IIA component